MSMIKGRVTIVSNKGKATNIQVDGTDWYGCGFVTPDKLPFKKGDVISFSYEENGQYKNVVLKSVEVERAVMSSAPPGGARKVEGMGKDQYWEQKSEADAENQKRICLQSCRNSAIEVTKMLKDLDALPLGSKKPDIAGNLVKFIDDLTDQFYKDTQNVAADKGRTAVVQEESFE